VPYQIVPYQKEWTGFAFSIVCLVGWFLSLILCISSDLSVFNGVQIVTAIVLRTFFQTGLFILAHDAMHQSLLPQRSRLNHYLGALALWCYGGLNYEQCRQNHVQHHRHPGAETDQDLKGKQFQVIRWYFSFIGSYLSPQLLLKILFNLAFLWILQILSHKLFQSSHVFNIETELGSLGLFYLLPLILSSLQLFIFGTYLPHRPIPGEPILPHHSRSLDYPQWLSFILCFHFGYHWEHHEYPYLPWYKLPAAHQQTLYAKQSS